MFVPLFIFRSFPFLASFLFSFQIFVSLSCISSLSCPLYTPSSRLSGDETSSTSDPSDLLLFLIPWTPPALLFSSWEARSLFVLSAAWKFPPDPWCSQAVVWFQISALVSRSYFLFTTFLPGTPVCSFSLQLIFSHIDWFTLFHFMESTTTPLCCVTLPSYCSRRAWTSLTVNVDTLPVWPRVVLCAGTSHSTVLAILSLTLPFIMKQ